VVTGPVVRHFWFQSKNKFGSLSYAWSCNDSTDMSDVRTCVQKVFVTKYEIQPAFLGPYTAS